MTGELYDIDAIGQIAYEHHILFVVDSAQSAGHISIDMQKSHIDLLTFSGHKALLGMSGVGGICVNTDIFIHPLKTGGTGIDSFNKNQPDSYPEHLEAGTLNIPGIASLNAGMTYLLEHQKEIEEKENNVVVNKNETITQAKYSTRETNTSNIVIMIPVAIHLSLPLILKIMIHLRSVMS